MPDKQKSSHLEQFIDGVVSPFSFSEKITGQLISVIMVDKVLADYEAISSRQSVRGFGEYLCEWFIIKTGTKKIAQIFVKNFVYALKELKRRHKRFHLFDRICGIGWIRGRNMQ